MPDKIANDFDSDASVLEPTHSRGDAQVSDSENSISTPPDVEESRAPKAVAGRKDKGRTHFSRHGLLSRDVERALVHSGENIKNIRRWERKYRSVLRPIGALADLFFDKWWSCHLRQLLIAKLEANVFAPDSSHRISSGLPVLEERARPTLIWRSDDENLESLSSELPEGLLRRLAVTQRYDSHYSREGHRLLALLLVMRDGGEDALARVFSATLGIVK